MEIVLSERVRPRALIRMVMRLYPATYPQLENASVLVAGQETPADSWVGNDDIVDLVPHTRS